MPAKKKNLSQKAAKAAPVAKTFKPYRIKKGEDYMSSQQLEHFKSILLERKKELMERVDLTMNTLRTTDVPPDPSDRATEEENFNLLLKSSDRERKLLKKIENALQQIEEQEYGHCEACGEEIGIGRLEARPTAALCIDCKTLSEMLEKRTVS